MWSFFFGLVLASTWFVTKDIKGWNWKTVAGFVGGAVIAYYITVATPAETSTNLMFIFLCGAIAICAMILPGISGSFILVLLGKYFYVMEAVKTLDLVVLGVFAFGAALGITSFSRVLSYALKNFRNITLSVLSGFMLGSLNKVWPWKEVEKLVSDGHEVMIEHNIAPNTEVAEAVVLMLIGFILVYVLEKISAKKGITDWMEMYKKSYFWPLVALCVVSLFLFLGQTFFNTRGEPREAVVALSMLQQGNWVLPVNNGVELHSSLLFSIGASQRFLRWPVR